jgi:hypothetical protein
MNTNRLPAPTAGDSELMEKLKVGFFIFLVLAIIGGILYGLYKLMSKVGIKPASKKTGDQCGLDIECVSQKCRFAMCL